MIATIQQHALRLFREQGYDATTVERICEAAEVSPSTFYRYFPNKEDVILTDAYDPLIIEAIRAQPEDRTVVEVLRAAMRTLYKSLSESEMQEIRERTQLMLTIPELRTAFLRGFGDNTEMLAQLAAARTGRDANDLEVRALAGAVMGVMLAVSIHWAEDPSQDMFALADKALAFLDTGMHLEKKASRGPAARPRGSGAAGDGAVGRRRK